MKKFLLALFVAFIGSASLNVAVFAHQYETSGTIGALMHVAPQDKPLSNSPTKLVFTFKDSANQFNLKNCNCTVVATHDGKQFLSQKLPVGTGLKTEAPITFPAAGEGYLITVKGAPSNGASFASFTFEYDDVKVGQGPHVWTTAQKIGIVAGVIAFLIMLVGVFFWLRSLDNADTEK